VPSAWPLQVSRPLSGRWKKSSPNLILLGSRGSDARSKATPFGCQRKTSLTNTRRSSEANRRHHVSCCARRATSTSDCQCLCGMATCVLTPVRQGLSEPAAPGGVLHLPEPAPMALHVPRCLSNTCRQALEPLRRGCEPQPVHGARADEQVLMCGCHHMERWRPDKQTHTTPLANHYRVSVCRNPSVADSTAQ